MLKARCEKYERLLETSGDPDLLRKFFEIEKQKKANQKEFEETKT